MRVRALTLAVAAALTLTSCMGGETAAPEDGTPAPGASGGLAYDSLEEIAAAFGCEKLQDVGTGGNQGLTAFGICYLGDDNIDIYMTSQRGLWEHLAAQFPSVLGPNWIIVCPTGAKAARLVHERLGGTLKIPKPLKSPKPKG